LTFLIFVILFYVGSAPNSGSEPDPECIPVLALTVSVRAVKQYCRTDITHFYVKGPFNQINTFDRPWFGHPLLYV
jgi:hypothetical protein